MYLEKKTHIMLLWSHFYKPCYDGRQTHIITVTEPNGGIVWVRLLQQMPDTESVLAEKHVETCILNKKIKCSQESLLQKIPENMLFHSLVTLKMS